MKTKYPLLICNVELARSGERTSDISFTFVDVRQASTYLQSQVDHEGDIVPKVRIYKNSPESMVLQIRTFGPVTGSSKGKPRAVFSQLSFNRQSMLAIADEIKRMALTLPEA